MEKNPEMENKKGAEEKEAVEEVEEKEEIEKIEKIEEKMLLEEVPQGDAEQGSASSLSSELGNIRISDSIVAKVAGLTAGKVEGVAGMRRSVGSGITEAFSRKNIGRGVKVEVTENEALINLYMVVDYGVFITDVARTVQQNVKESVENFTGLHVKEVNIFVQGIQLPALEPEEKKKK